MTDDGARNPFEAIGETTGDGPLPPERSSFARRAREPIRRANADGVLPHGGQVSPREAAAPLAVSPTPVREAPIHPDPIGLVGFPPGRIRIASRRPAVLRAAHEPREALEAMAPRRAAVQRAPEEAVPVRDLAEFSVAAAEGRERDRVRLHDASFHGALGPAARSQRLEQYASNAPDVALTFRNLGAAGRSFTARAAPLHIAVAGVIGRGDADGAESVRRERVRAVQIVPGGEESR
jgi:DNA-binding GntR family transcriptional regulator